MREGGEEERQERGGEGRGGERERGREEMKGREEREGGEGRIDIRFKRNPTRYSTIY